MAAWDAFEAAVKITRLSALWTASQDAILGVIRARLGGDAQIGAEEGGSEFGDLSGQIDDQTPKGRRRPQYSSASMIVRTRVVFCGSPGSSEPYCIDLS